MMSVPKVAIVNYLNTLPFLHGLRSSGFVHEMELIEVMPSLCARYFTEQKVDISLVPVGALPSFPDSLFSPYGIACDGPVASVCLLSEVPLHQVNRVLLDYQSRTSVLLVRILLEKYWKLFPRFQAAGEGFENAIHGNTAGLVIGDRALLMSPRYPYVFDLGQAWKDYTGLPFVFAVWMYNRLPNPDFIRRFNKALQFGLDHIDAAIHNNTSYDAPFLKQYFNRNIQYLLEPEYLKGMRLFFHEKQSLEASLTSTLG